MESLELFAREVLPEFQEREARREREKAERLAPMLEAVMARKPATDHPPLRPGVRDSRHSRARARTARRSDKFHRYLDDHADKIAAGEDVRRRLA